MKEPEFETSPFRLRVAKDVFGRSSCLAALPQSLLRGAAGASILLAVLASQPSLAQSTTADVSGTVTDNTGALVSSATIELTNIETHEKRTATSGSAGEFNFTLLKPSRYAMTVNAAGFKGFSIASFGLAAGDRAREDAHLTVGSTDETVTVEATPPALHTDTAALITSVTETGVAAERTQLHQPGAGHAGGDRRPQQWSCQRQSAG